MARESKTLNNHAVVDVNRAATLAKVHEVFAAVLGVSVKELGDDKYLERMGIASLEDFQAVQLVVFVLKHLLADMWKSWEGEPNAVASHR